MHVVQCRALLRYELTELVQYAFDIIRRILDIEWGVIRGDIVLYRICERIIYSILLHFITYTLVLINDTFVLKLSLAGIHIIRKKKIFL